MQFDYTTVGHVTVDVLEDGTRRPGGTALYGALQAARLGARTRVLTRGSPRELAELIEPFRAELELEVQPAARTTTLRTSGRGSARAQRLLAWAGALAPLGELDTRILHLAPVARELPASWRTRAGFVGLTPQGLLRSWPRGGGAVSLRAARARDGELAARCHALVLSERERAPASALLSAAARAGALVAITAAAQPTTLLLADARTLEVPVHAAPQPVDDLGAGDVFAAALFLELCDGREPREAARFAQAAAALRVSGAGAGAIATRAAIERVLDGTGARQ